MKKYQKNDSISYVLGTTLVIETLKNKRDIINKIYFNPNIIKNNTYDLILDLSKNIPLIESAKAFNILAKKDNIYVIAEINKYASKIDSGNHLVIINPENEGNLGTIMRSALGFGIKNLVIITPAVDYFNPSVIRASMGAIFNLNIETYSSFLEYNQKYPHMNYYPFMLKAKSSLNNTVFKEPYSLVFGPESAGLDDSYLNIGEPVIINHDSSIDSLNLPIAVSIALYEVTKNNYIKN